MCPQPSLASAGVPLHVLMSPAYYGDKCTQHWKTVFVEAMTAGQSPEAWRNDSIDGGGTESVSSVSLSYP